MVRTPRQRVLGAFSWFGTGVFMLAATLLGTVSADGPTQVAQNRSWVLFFAGAGIVAILIGLIVLFMSMLRFRKENPDGRLYAKSR